MNQNLEPIKNDKWRKNIYLAFVFCCGIVAEMSEAIVDISPENA